MCVFPTFLRGTRNHKGIARNHKGLIYRKSESTYGQRYASNRLEETVVSVNFSGAKQVHYEATNPFQRAIYSINFGPSPSAARCFRDTGMDRGLKFGLANTFWG